MSPSAHDPMPLAERALAQLRGWGLEPGDRVISLLPNQPSTLALGLAAMAAGVVQVPLPVTLTAEEASRIAADADPSLAVVGPSVASAVTEALGRRSRVEVLSGDRLEDVRPEQPASWWPRTRPMAYTSGTTGRRKGVHVGVHDHAWGEAVVEDEHAAFARRHGERHLVVSPLHHSGPFRFAFTTALTGGTVAILPSFDVDAWLGALRELRPTSMFCVPTHLRRLLSHPAFGPDDLASLTLLAHAGAPCPEPLKEQVLDAAPEGSVWEFYGATEGQFAVAPPDVWRAHPGSVGVARADRRLEVRNGDGTQLPDGEVGSVWVHAPGHARWEYWRDPDRTEGAWDGDAFTVGDLGALADGVLTLHGRPGDLVITGGVNVYPAEVERELLGHPDVTEVVVFGVPDEEWGERVTAAVVLRPGRQTTTDDLLAYARDRLAREKVPKEVLVVGDLPRTPTGKVRRVGLAEQLGT